VRQVFEDQGWEDYTSWLKSDRKMLAYVVTEAEIIILAARYHY
jgi:Txe/YoeB family toxin of Txe-Axe toxin-antitoxin module